jgi:hypothetical protein
MRDDEHQTAQRLPDLSAETVVLVEHGGADGIARYLRTMHDVAHAPGMCHWCTPGHNRGKASEALSMEATTLPVVRVTVRLATNHG